MRATYPTVGRLFYEWGVLDERLRKAARCRISGTGTDLVGRSRGRDVDFSTPTERGARGIAKRLRALRLPGVLVEVRCLNG